MFSEFSVHIYLFQAEDKYQSEIRKLHREMEAYREKVSTLTAQQATYANMIQAFERALQGMVRRVEGLQVASQQKVNYRTNVLIHI